MSRDAILLSSSVMLVALIEWLLYVRGSFAILQISLIMFAKVFFPSAAITIPNAVFFKAISWFLYASRN
jgi:hypothetical protein